MSLPTVPLTESLDRLEASYEEYADENQHSSDTVEKVKLAIELARCVAERQERVTNPEISDRLDKLRSQVVYDMLESLEQSRVFQQL